MCGIPGERFAPLLDWTPGECSVVATLVGKTTILLSIRCKLISPNAIFHQQEHTIGANPSAIHQTQ